MSGTHQLLMQQETVYSIWWLAKNKLQNCEMRCSTRIHFRTFHFSSLYQRSLIYFRSSWPYHIFFRYKFVLLKQGNRYCFTAFTMLLVIRIINMAIEQLSFNMEESVQSHYVLHFQIAKSVSKRTETMRHKSIRR